MQSCAIHTRIRLLQFVEFAQLGLDLRGQFGRLGGSCSRLLLVVAIGFRLLILGGLLAFGLLVGGGVCRVVPFHILLRDFAILGLGDGSLFLGLLIVEGKGGLEDGRIGIGEIIGAIANVLAWFLRFALRSGAVGT